VTYLSKFKVKLQDRDAIEITGDGTEHSFSSVVRHDAARLVGWNKRPSANAAATISAGERSVADSTPHQMPKD